MLDLIKDALSSYHAIIFMGASGSGKTTTAKAFAERREMAFLDLEEILANDQNSDADGASLINQAIQARADAGEKAAIACPALTPDYRAILEQNDIKICYVLLEGDEETLLKRNEDPQKQEQSRQDLASLNPPKDAIRVDIRQHVESIMTNVDFQLIQRFANA